MDYPEDVGWTAYDGSPMREWTRPAHIEVQGAARQPGEWFACEHPERPFTEDTALHDCCRACLVGAQAAVASGLHDTAELLPFMLARLDEWGEAPRLDPVR